MNEETKVKIDVDVGGNAIDVIGSLQKAMKGLERDLRRLSAIGGAVAGRGAKPRGQDDAATRNTDQLAVDRIALRGLRERMSFASRMARQRAGEEDAASRAARSAGAEAMRSLRQRMSFTARMTRQREAEEEGAARTEARRVRDQIKHHRFLFGLRMRHERAVAAERQRSVQNVYSGFSGMRSSASQIRQAASAPARAAAAGGLVAAGAVRAGIGSRMTTDTAETNLRMFGGDGISLMSQSQVKAVREGWLDKEALRNGMNVPAALNAYTEVLKAGIEKSQAADVTKEILKATAGMDLNVPETTKLVGRLAQLTKGGPAEIGGMLNSMGIVAAQTAADSNELVSSLRRGAGALANKNFKVSDLTAFTGVGISAGIQEGMAGTFIEHQQRDLLNAKYARGQQAKDYNKAFGLLGMGSRGSVSARMAQNPADTLEQLYTRLGDIAEKDPVKANLIASLIGGDEWGGKMLMMAQSSGKIRSTRQAANDPNNKDFLSTLKGERLGSWAGMWNTTKATFQLFWEKFGLGFDGILRDVTTYFADLGQRFDWNRVTLHVQAFMDGLKEGFGVRTWRELIDNITGSFGTGDMITKLNDFGRGVSQGITSFVDVIKTVGSSIGFDGQQSAQDIGKLAAQITLLSASLIVLAPVVSVLSLLAGGINLIVTALTAARGLLALLGIGTGAGSAVAAGGAAGAVAAGGAGTIAYLITKHLTDSFPDFKKPPAEGIREDQSRGWMGRTWNWMLGRSPSGTTVQRQSFLGDAHRSLIQNASYGRNERSVREEPSLRSMIQTASLSNMSDRLGGLIQYASLGGGLGSALGSFSGGSGSGSGGGSGSYGSSTGALLSGQTPGSQLGNVGMGYRGIIGGSGTAPGGNAGATFAAKAPGVMKDLMRDFNLTKEQAAGIVANLGHESAGFTAYQEGNPRGGGRGGAGWAQWTGPRRRQFEAWAAARNLDPRSDAANYGFLKHELQTTHAGSLAAVKRESTAQGSMVAFENNYERAGVKNWASRQGYLNKALSIGEGGSGGSTDTVSAVKASAAASAVDVAKSFEGAHELRDNARLTGFMKTEIRGAQNAWCADFVNSSLRAVGMKGTGSRVANSFLGWGQGVDAKDALKGDVLVEHRGRGLNGQGGHVGLATGNKRINPRTGELELESISGNSSNMVKTEWERASKLAVRRSTEVAQAAAAAVDPDRFKDIASYGGMTSSGWKAGAGGNAKAIEGASKAPLPSARMSPDDATRNLPLNPLNSGEVGRRLDAGTPGGGAGGGGNGSPQIIIQGHNGDPEALANAVQRRLSEKMGRRTHEVEHHWG